MPLYQNKQEVTQTTDSAFDATYSPGATAPHAGIYLCVKCGHEIGIAQGHTLPSQSHTQHPQSLGAIEWKLLVYAQHNQ